MIQQIQLDKIASYTNTTSMQPLAINFCYGSNGSGKSTLAKGLSGVFSTPNCDIVWRPNTLPVLVYNKQFVESNFGESIGGIFTLGEDSKEAQEFIKEKTDAIKDIDTSITALTSSKEKIEQEQRQAKSGFENACWAVQQSYGATFADALVGYRGSRDKFAQKCLDEYQKLNSSIVPVLKHIEELYIAAYGEQKEKYDVFDLIDTATIGADEKCDLLDKRITGSIETPVGKFIDYLQNSDWVKQGVAFSERTNGKCPYCQQSIPENIQQDIVNFFDASYENDCAELAKFSSRYSNVTELLLSKIKNIISKNIPILNYDLFNAELKNISNLIESNRKIISEKIESPGNKVKIESLIVCADRLNKVLESFNEKIKRNNDIVNNQTQNKAKCVSDVWNFFTYELREVIAQYQKKANGLSAGYKSILDKIKNENETRNNTQRLIAEKEETITSVLPTVNAINTILERFGFTGFKLSENQTQKGTYKIIRPDGSDAKKTLSEGEHNFIAFLYFFHLVYGSFERTGIAKDKIVVIDDPISSLDSNVLFIITTLAKTFITDCLDEKNGIKQVFILTHNVYFHKEVTFRGSRSKYPPTRTAYWVIRKIDGTSEIVKFDENPIKTSYELLWNDLADIENTQRVTVFNTLRRILEYYFNIIGGLDYEKCINEFDGQDKIICKALIATINDGSHFISDDFVMCYESDVLENYLRVFRLIFDKMGHSNHYKMMMKELDSALADGEEQTSAMEAV